MRVPLSDLKVDLVVLNLSRYRFFTPTYFSVSTISASSSFDPWDTPHGLAILTKDEDLSRTPTSLTSLTLWKVRTVPGNPRIDMIIMFEFPGLLPRSSSKTTRSRHWVSSPLDSTWDSGYRSISSLGMRVLWLSLLNVSKSPTTPWIRTEGVVPTRSFSHRIKGWSGDGLPASTGVCGLFFIIISWPQVSTEGVPSPHLDQPHPMSTHSGEMGRVVFRVDVYVSMCFLVDRW